MGWRDHLPVHPAADLFPVMSEMELRELGEDIKTNGLVSPLTLYGDKLLDGRNRLDAMELVGITLDWGAGDDYTATLQGMVYSLPDRLINPYDYVVSTNLHRRHLTGEQKRELIAKILKAKPEASNRKIAKQTKTDHKTVAAVRGDLESTGEIPQLEKTTGADGKQRKSRAKKAPEPIGSGSSEINVEQRKAEHARKAAEDVIKGKESGERSLLVSSIQSTPESEKAEMSVTDKDNELMTRTCLTSVPEMFGHNGGPPMDAVTETLQKRFVPMEWNDPQCPISPEYSPVGPEQDLRGMPKDLSCYYARLAARQFDMAA